MVSVESLHKSHIYLLSTSHLSFTHQKDIHMYIHIYVCICCIYILVTGTMISIVDTYIKGIVPYAQGWSVMREFHLYLILQGLGIHGLNPENKLKVADLKTAL